MDAASLRRARVTGARPYKVPETDGRRARWAVARVDVTPREYRIIRTVLRVAIHEVLRTFRPTKK